MKPSRIQSSSLIRNAAVAAGLGLLVLLPFLGRPLIDREQELRVVLTARDLARGGNWLIPQYLGESRLNKPPLQYWLTALAFRAAGDARSPTVARLPAALLAAALLAALGTLGARLVGSRRALAAAAFAATTVLFWRFGRLAETDMSLACFETLAVLCLFRVMQGPPAQAARWGIATGLSAGIGFMIKGPAAIVLPAVSVLAFWLTSPRAQRQPLPVGAFLSALAVWLLLAAPWYVYLFISQAGAAAAQDIGQELHALGPHTSHAAPLLFYCYALPLAMLPWGLLLPFAGVRAWRTARRHAGVRWVLCWFLGSLLVMSATPSRQIHYATLLLAPAALLLAIGWGACVRRLGRPPRTRRVAIALAAITVIGFWAVGGVLHELSEPAAIVRQSAAAIEQTCAPGAQVFLAGRRLNAMRYYLDRPIVRVTSLDEGLARATTGDLVVLAADSNNPVLPPSPPMPPIREFRQCKVIMQIYRK